MKSGRCIGRQLAPGFGLPLHYQGLGLGKPVTDKGIGKENLPQQAG